MGFPSAIETNYRGCRFRSRLEARWVVFFDAMGIKWNYEMEGFKLPSGCYLPDFWLPQVSMWAEVKPEAFTPHELNLCLQLSYITSKGVLLLDGPPSDRSYFALENADFNRGMLDVTIAEYNLLDSNHYYLSESRFFWEDMESLETGCCDYDLPVFVDMPKFNFCHTPADEMAERALRLSKSARFEPARR